MLARAVRIFEAFTPEDPALTVSEISPRTGLHAATASAWWPNWCRTAS
ncbi:helix-turn-helix domain-containing protein [Streptomyces canus]